MGEGLNEVTRRPLSVLMEAGGVWQGRCFLRCPVTSFWNHRGHFGAAEGAVGGGGSKFPQVDEALGTWVSHQQLDVPG